MNMSKIDYRSLGPEELKDLRENVFAAYERKENVSAVAKNVGVTQQQIQKQTKQDKEIGRPRFRLYDADISRLRETLSQNSPSQVGIDSPLWNVSSLHKLVEMTLPVEVTPYLVRRILLKLGFPRRERVECVFQRSYTQTEGLSALAYARKYNMRCFYLTLTKDTFVTAISPRGDVRFISKDYKTDERITNWLIKLLYRRGKKKLLIFYNLHRLTYGLFDYYNVPKNVVVLRE